ncbi:hypothetical protein RRG08_021052 [Elysia crispata]|uniref:Uncharacterized protein n=1 Tax=Elysia crispata TaxID=231223 RepID=A0AAE0Z0Z6_9GAST|nr:hypothetical protein RRG08_021052 [Elysia crispata]
MFISRCAQISSSTPDTVPPNVDLLYVHTVYSPRGALRSLGPHRHCPAICGSVMCTYSMFTSRSAQISSSTPDTVLPYVVLLCVHTVCSPRDVLRSLASSAPDTVCHI